MVKVLYIQASPRKERSNSNTVADAFIKAYQESHPQDKIVKFNLFDQTLPVFDGYTLDAKYAILHGQQHSQEQAQAWQTVEKIIAQFKSADKYVFSVPMWNFGIPYILKHYIDIIAQPGYTFSYDPQSGYRGLMNDKPIFVAYARGGAYSSPEATKLDFQKTYFDFLLAFLGFSDIKTVVIEPTLAAPETVEENLSSAVNRAREMAKEF